jgi:hypothetical protein
MDGTLCNSDLLFACLPSPVTAGDRDLGYPLHRTLHNIFSVVYIVVSTELARSGMVEGSSPMRY